MNIIHQLRVDKSELTAQRIALVSGINDLRNYLLSPKFSCGDRLDGYVNVDDIFLRLNETTAYAIRAGDKACSETSQLIAQSQLDKKTIA